MIAQDITLFIYNLTLFPIIFFSVLFIILSLVNLYVDKEQKRRIHRLNGYPFISVQVPTFNDPVAERCIRHCMDFDYPDDRYEIIIADDSTNLQTQMLLSKFAEDNPSLIKYIHRDNRDGYKPGALRNAMKITKGEIIVIFDADWMPAPDFLKTIIEPFADLKVAIVQTRQGFYNKETNLITRFAAYLLQVYHTIIMPINNRINCVFFCGTAGAIRRDAFEKVGGWNLHSITEDSDLSVKLLMKGYRSVYLKIDTPSEVPDTFEGFVKQQMRWCYGNVRVFMDNYKKILFSRGLTIRQRLMITYITIGNVAAPVVVLMTFFGFAGWFVGEPSLMQLQDILPFLARFLYTAGFLIMGLIALKKHKQIQEFGYMVASAFTVGLVLAVANSFAFAKAITNRKLSWYCTPKADNDTVSK